MSHSESWNRAIFHDFLTLCVIKLSHEMQSQPLLQKCFSYRADLLGTYTL